MAGVNGFIAAFASGDEGRLRSVYPGLRGDEPWWQFAASHAKESLRVAYREVLSGYPQVEGDSAEVRFTVSLTYVGNSGAPRPTTFLARLTREASRWRIAEVRYF